MSGPVALIPITEVQRYMGEAVQRLKRAGIEGREMQVALSIASYLKDARRWHYAEGHILPDLSGEPLRKFVDGEIGQ